MKCGRCKTEFFTGRYCPNCGADMQDENNVYQGEIPKKEYPMKWYKFLKVSLWIGAILNLSYGVNHIAGNAYDSLTDKVYEAVPALQGLDIIYGLALFAVAALGIATWSGLKDYKASGPKLLMATYVAAIAVGVIYTLAYNTIVAGVDVIYGEAYQVGDHMYTPYIDLGAGGGTGMASIITSVAMAIYNYKYFKEREDLFIN